MWVCAREAARILPPVVSGDALAKILLRSGLAGHPFETGRGPPYDDQRVVALARRPVVDDSELSAVCPHGRPDGPVLEPPGGWARVVTGRRWHTARGGGPA
jgi:hypothetical protein